MPASVDDLFPDAPTIATQRVSIEESRAVSFALVVIDGPDRGRKFILDGMEPLRVLVGKGPVCDFRVVDPEVSRRHFALQIVDRKLRITDVGSTNGTFVEGVSIADAYLRGGETIRFGSTACRIDPLLSNVSSEPPAASAFGRVLGASVVMRRLYPLCERLAQAPVPVILEGETGTGKEQLALALHERGPRCNKPFVVFDCTAVAPNLIESELFGHERGSFTGSVASHRGVFERANEGTLLIDEIGDMPLELQPKLLRMLERSEVTRVGGEVPQKVDVRVLVATRRDLDHEVQLGRFRDDLFHRIAVTRVELPPLRARRGDVALLARHFVSELGGSPDSLSEALLKLWDDYAWPGNVRELRNATARRIALGDLVELQPNETWTSTKSSGSPAVATRGDPIARILALDLPIAEARQRLIDEFDERYVEHLLENHGGNMVRAAASAGVARRHFQRLKAKSNKRGDSE
jgi:two-component system, NtrC family, response regulator HydG